MAFAVMGTKIGPLKIEESNSINTSFPNFKDELINWAEEFIENFIITIDGPAASGKEKISEYISKKWKLKHLDSGILYRRLALIFLNNNVDTAILRK